MARASGRDLIVKKDDTTIAAIREKTVAIGAEPVDITTDDDAGWRTLLAEPGQRQIDISFSGVTTDDLLLAAIMAGTPFALEDIEVEFPSGATLAGDFFMTSLSQTGTYNEATTFEGELQSSGAVTYTAASS